MVKLLHKYKFVLFKLRTALNTLPEHPSLKLAFYTRIGRSKSEAFLCNPWSFLSLLF